MPIRKCCICEKPLNIYEEIKIDGNSYCQIDAIRKLVKERDEK